MNSCVQPAESARASIHSPLSGSAFFVLTGSWARAASSTAMWSVAVLDPALPGRSTPASASLVASRKHSKG